MPVPPPAGSKRGLKIGLIIGGIVLLLLCLCGGAAVYGLAKLGEAESKPAAVSSRSVGAAPSTSPGRRSSPSPSPTGESADDEDTLAKGDCVVNDGNNSDPKLRKVTCGPNTYEILLKIPFTTDSERCNNQFGGAPGTEATFTRDGTGTLNDFVLCMKKR
ncbi:LppU/SCO3897 family protein [Planosporangium sp. 12N6]|uniref:LppU/SCO3897 family protein n=1 Tax=Planosporangium spinosum TaxID=3402278 RepID=UPI003CF4CC2C